MTTENQPPPARPAVTVTTADGRRAELTLVGDIDADVLPALEEQLGAAPLSAAAEWIVDMNAVTRIDLACAYALLRAATRLPEAKITILWARPSVQRTLRHAGLDAVAAIEER
ncbi:STAS domain-containing protein [Streptomyces sp. NPDC051907]|uniref:STAS domain-containing protein n=1 Tax=Streptomyces sp. NPDC051907 TaxID=3155284 RepID=UPI003419B1CF